MPDRLGEKGLREFLYSATQATSVIDIPSPPLDLDKERWFGVVLAHEAIVEVREAAERHKRRKALAAETIASKEELATAGYPKELAETRLDIATAQRGEKRARAAQLRQLRADSDLRAPFAGIVAARYVDPGANVTATTRIVRLISSKPPFVRFAVRETSRVKITKGL